MTKYKVKFKVTNNKGDFFKITTVEIHEPKYDDREKDYMKAIFNFKDMQKKLIADAIKESMDTSDYNHLTIEDFHGVSNV